MGKGWFEGEVAFITGASAGIGKAVALELVAQGAKVVLAARRMEKLRELEREIGGRGGEALAVQCDVRERASLDAAVAEAVGRFGGIDLVFANAGYGVTGSAYDLTADDYRAQFETNVFGVIETVYATLPHVTARKGRVGVVSSVMGRIAVPASAPYCASKHALCGFADCLYYDLLERGVSMTLINPGIVESEIRSISNAGEYTGAPDPAPTFLIMPTRTAARHIVRALYRRKPEYVVTLHGKIGVGIARHFPRTMRFLFRTLSRSGLNKLEEAKRKKAAQ